MTSDDKKLIANEIEKYFIGRRINSRWFETHRDQLIALNEEFKPTTLSKIEIDESSIDVIDQNKVSFSGTGVCRFEDPASQVGANASVRFVGTAILDSIDDRVFVSNVMLTQFQPYSIQYSPPITIPSKKPAIQPASSFMR